MALYGVVMRWFNIRISEYDIKLIEDKKRNDIISDPVDELLVP